MFKDFWPVLKYRLLDSCYFYASSAASEGAFCGNKIVEEGEECDCGYDYLECADHCCYPRNLSQRDLDLNKSAVACGRRVATECRYLLCGLSLFSVSFEEFLQKEDKSHILSNLEKYLKSKNITIEVCFALL